jgi:type IV pilus assembly protein PilY1
MKKIMWLRVVLLLLCGGWCHLVQAEDIDIYSNNTSNLGRPNVLLVLDNAANFSADAASCTYVDGTAPSLNGTAGGIEQCALYNVVYGLPVNADGSGVVNIGLMAYNANNMRDIHNANCGGSNGGCLMVPLMEMTAANKATFLAWVKSWNTTGGVGNGYIKANGEATAATMQEAWAYYAGGTGLSGRSYAGVQPSAGCQKNFLIFVGNAFNNSGTPGDGGSTSPKNALAAAPGVTSTQLVNITIPSGSYGTSSFSCGNYSMGNHTDPSGLYADEWARYMYQTDLYSGYEGGQGITTYTVGLLGTSCKPDFPALMTSMAKYGGGKYFPTSNYSEIAAALLNILNEVQAVNSVFSSASLPVSVNAQGTYLNQIFLGMFRPDASASPRWLGNLKQYQFILQYPDPINPDPNKATLLLGDSTGASALSSAGTGFIAPSAVSFWTSKDFMTAPDSTGGFFKNDVRGAGGAFDSPDGELVEKGGVAQQLRISNLTVNYASTPASPRRLYTALYTNYANCQGATPAAECSLSHASNAFATTNTAITETALGVTAAERTNLINWVRGEDNCTASACVEKGPGSPYNVRPSIHGDVLHSRPVVINYGDSRGLVVFYGANDGVFRAVNGNQTGAIGAVPAGGELWGLVLPDHFSKLNRQRINSPELKLPSTPTGTSALPKDYFVDGLAGAYQKLKADGTIDKAYLYLTMRRGGRFIYALDVSDPTAPRLLWKISATDAGFSELGQTWSRPRVTLVKGYADPVLVFGAGYDTAEDAEPPTADTMGRGIFVVNALTGVRVWSASYTAGGTVCNGTSTQAACAVAGMNWAIPADISFVDRDNDGKTDRLYAADMGGNVWRVDLEPTGSGTPDTWRVTKLAALGCDTGVCASGITPRKFFYPPNVVLLGATGAAGSYDAVLIGAGDREHPLIDTANSQSAYNKVNRFYMVKDTRTGKDAAADTAGYPAVETGLFDATASNYDNTLKGYYVTLAAGEKVVNASITVRGTTFFGTNRPVPPSPTSCVSNLGEARGYALDPFKGTSTHTIYDGGGLPPTPVAGIVSIRISATQSVQQSFCVGCGGTSSISSGGDARSALGAVDLNKKVPKKPRRTYWYKR